MTIIRKNIFIKILSMRCIKLIQNTPGAKNFSNLALKEETVGLTQMLQVKILSEEFSGEESSGEELSGEEFSSEESKKISAILLLRRRLCVRRKCSK
jgi:hypothetical protein